MRRSSRQQIAFRALCLATMTLSFCSVLGDALASEIYVQPDGSDLSAGTLEQPLRTIQAAVERALPGDVIRLLAGRYAQDVATVRDGRAGQPITIIGTPETVVTGAGASRIFWVKHDHIRLEGFVVDGHFTPTHDAKDAYRDKLVYVMSATLNEHVAGFEMTGMLLQNAGSECVRLRYGTSQSQIWGNFIRSCGNWDFQFFDGGKNGEAIYVGTAPEQLGMFDAPSADPDHSNENWIHHNYFDTRGNECVDVKEGSTRNVVEFNTCTGQADTESGGLDARGSGNVIRFNDVFGNFGVGVRLGGDEDNDGVENEVYGNVISGNLSGGIRVQRDPQAAICDNQFIANGNKPVVGSFGRLYPAGQTCDGIMITDMSLITGSPIIATTVDTVGAGSTSDWPLHLGEALAALELAKGSPSTPSETSETELPAGASETSGNGYIELRCPVIKVHCVLGIFRPGEGLHVLQATDKSLEGMTIGFAGALNDDVGTLVDPDRLADHVVGIEYERRVSAGLVGPVLLLVVSTSAN